MSKIWLGRPVDALTLLHIAVVPKGRTAWSCPLTHKHARDTCAATIGHPPASLRATVLVLQLSEARGAAELRTHHGAWPLFVPAAPPRPYPGNAFHNDTRGRRRRNPCDRPWSENRRCADTTAHFFRPGNGFDPNIDKEDDVLTFHRHYRKQPPSEIRPEARRQVFVVSKMNKRPAKAGILFFSFQLLENFVLFFFSIWSFYVLLNIQWRSLKVQITLAEYERMNVGGKDKNWCDKQTSQMT